MPAKQIMKKTILRIISRILTGEVVGRDAIHKSGIINLGFFQLGQESSNIYSLAMAIRFLCVMYSLCTVCLGQPSPPKDAKPFGYIVIESIPPFANKMMLALDSDGNGRLSEEEIKNASQNLRALDDNRDRQLSPRELTPYGKSEELKGEMVWERHYGLTRLDCHELKKRLGVERIITERSTAAEASYADFEKDGLGEIRRANVRVIGTTAGVLGPAGIQLLKGRFLNKHDNDYHQTVAVIGEDVAKVLFPSENPLEKIIRVSSVESQLALKVIGITKGDAHAMGIFIPQGTMKEQIGDKDIRRFSGSLTVAICEVHRAWIPTSERSMRSTMIKAKSYFKERRIGFDLQIKFQPLTNLK